MANSLVIGLRVLFTALGCAMTGTLVYTLSVDDLPFRKDLLTPWMAATLIDFYINVVPLVGFGVMSQVKDSDDEPVAHSLEIDKPDTGSVESIGGGEIEEEDPVDKPDDRMDEDAAVFCIRLKQPRSDLQHKMSVPELCPNFRS